jgi:hypothetical protein
MVFDSRHEAPSTSHLQDIALFLIVFHFIDWPLLAGSRPHLQNSTLSDNLCQIKFEYLEVLRIKCKSPKHGNMLGAF